MSDYVEVQGNDFTYQEDADNGLDPVSSNWPSE